MTEQLKPCPFACGKKPSVQSTLIEKTTGKAVYFLMGTPDMRRHYREYFVSCECGAKTGEWAKTKRTAVRRWNRRTQ